ncbi:LacI family DNA-binding transcriptional regulator [Sinomicrobium pectinilyticum]|uniref:LacI family DNA-binding transcriptional regulator n=1 Tax=Sinomicrobium pectinilyticum TaxID=1084421 RepID=A0A3N0DR58_SINP1|nr:substrate-binding domain-containing protein [Sinomicrobium pectinilyticum]RNL77833.1 LacI family DNA-binding transcriptional regulator [Sinomicrobium pectinilyticum]
MLKKKYTIADIAFMAGVSKGTVDRVIHKRGKVSKKAHEKITKILKEIDYQPNLVARNLKKNKIYRLLVLIPDPEKDAYWAPCVEGIETAAGEFQAFGVMIETFLFDPSATKSFISKSKEVLKNKPDGVVFVPLFYKEALTFVESCKKNNVTLATFNSYLSADNTRSFIGQDLHRSGRVAGKLMHMLLGNKKQAAVVHMDEAYKNAIHMQEKEKGFRDYFEGLKQGYDIVTHKVPHKDIKNVRKSVKDFLKDNPGISGIFVTTSKAYLLAEALPQTGPAVSVVGYDLIDKNIECLRSGSIDFLIHQNPKQQAYLGVSYLSEYFAFDKKIPDNKLLPIDIITSENYMHYLE